MQLYNVRMIQIARNLPHTLHFIIYRRNLNIRFFEPTRHKSLYFKFCFLELPDYCPFSFWRPNIRNKIIKVVKHKRQEFKIMLMLTATALLFQKCGDKVWLDTYESYASAPTLKRLQFIAQATHLALECYAPVSSLHIVQCLSQKFLLLFDI